MGRLTLTMTSSLRNVDDLLPSVHSDTPGRYPKCLYTLYNWPSLLSSRKATILDNLGCIWSVSCTSRDQPVCFLFFKDLSLPFSLGS